MTPLAIYFVGSIFAVAAVYIFLRLIDEAWEGGAFLCYIVAGVFSWFTIAVIVVGFTGLGLGEIVVRLFKKEKK